MTRVNQPQFSCSPIKLIDLLSMAANEGYHMPPSMLLLKIWK